MRLSNRSSIPAARPTKRDPAREPQTATLALTPTNTPLRIALVSETYPPEINGVAHTLQRYEQALRQAGHRVQIVRPRQFAGERAGGDGVRDECLVTGIPLPMYRNLRFGITTQARLMRLWRDDRPHALYIATEGPLGRTALDAARRLDIPVASGFHTQFDRYAHAYRLGWLQAPLARYLRAFHNRCQLTLVPTHALRYELESRGFERLQVKSRGVDTELFTPARRDETLRAQWGLAPEAIAMLYVGRIAHEKNIELLLRSYRYARDIHHELRLIMVGEGPDAARLRRQHPDIVFCGAQRGTALAAHYASADLFVFASESETYGNVVAEAMASALPVVGYAYAAAAELIRDGECGFLAPYRDTRGFLAATHHALESRDRWQSIGQHARWIAQRRAWPAIQGEFVEMIQMLASGLPVSSGAELAPE
ncbi:MAG: glycosyltransferase family 4 protein [Thiotrichales bacterium]